jgi:predicted metal-dependent HD superfamily phosphohydrolase
MSTSLRSWLKPWHELGAHAADEVLYERLIAGWSEEHRRYHTLQHLRECLAQFEAARSSAQRPGEIELALWFHDAFYDPRRADNEERSAHWARVSVLQAGLSAETADRVQSLVMATRHATSPADTDAQLLVDIDLAILGAEPERFDEYDAQIRAEYAHVLDEEFREGRRRILNGFLARPRLYCTRHFYSMLEARARENLHRAVARLASSPGLTERRSGTPVSDAEVGDAGRR